MAKEHVQKYKQLVEAGWMKDKILSLPVLEHFQWDKFTNRDMYALILKNCRTDNKHLAIPFYFHKKMSQEEAEKSLSQKVKDDFYRCFVFDYAHNNIKEELING